MGCSYCKYSACPTRLNWIFHDSCGILIFMHLQGGEGLAAGAQRFPAETHETN